MFEKVIKTEESHIQKRECEINLKDGVIISNLSEANKKQKEETK